MLRVMMVSRLSNDLSRLISSWENIRNGAVAVVWAETCRRRNSSDCGQTLNKNPTPGGTKKASKKQIRTIKALHRENLALFGVLLETKVEKVKRIRKEGNSSQASEKSPGVKKKSREDLIKAAYYPLIDVSDKTRGVIDYTQIPNFEDKSSSTLSRASTVKLEQAGASINKNRRNSEYSDDNYAKATSKGTEIDWTMKIAPKKVKLITLSAQPSVKKSAVVDDQPSSSPTMEQIVSLYKPDKNGQRSGDTEDGKANCPSVFVDFSIPYYNPEKGNLEDVVSTDPNSAGNIKNNRILSFPYPGKSLNTNSESSSNFTPSSSASEETRNEKIPSVSRILQATMPPEQAEALKRWEQRMIAEKGVQGFLEYKQEILHTGKLLHSSIERYLRGTPADQLVIAEQNQGHWNSLNAVLQSLVEQYQPSTGAVHVLESYVIHPKLQYCGIIDCVAEFRNRLVVIDWKTSQKYKPFVSMTYDTPLQIAAYIGAINYDPRYSLKINDGLIVVAYEDGSSCQIFSLGEKDLEKYWKLWLGRLQRFRKITAVP